MKKSLSRRAFVLTSLMAAPTVAYARFVEPDWLDFTHHTIPLPGLAGSLKLVQLSDLHASPEVPIALIEQSVEMAIAAQPDLILLTGDYVTTDRGFDPAWYERLLRRLPDAAPTYAIFGNHDGPVCGFGKQVRVNAILRRVLMSAGVTLLDNKSTRLTVRGSTLQLVGVGDLYMDEVDLPSAFGQTDPNLPTIFLCHNPDGKWLARDYSWQVMISGHTHGGQIVLPLVDFCVVPVRDRRYISGLKPWRDRLVFVSRGVGNIGGFRFNCRPEVSCLHLVAS